MNHLNYNLYLYLYFNLLKYFLKFKDRFIFLFLFQNFNFFFSKLFKFNNLNNLNYLNLNKVNLLTNFYNFFKSRKPYAYLYQYKFEKDSRSAFSNLFSSLNWHFKNEKFVCKNKDYIFWNTLNKDFFFFNYIFIYRYLYLFFIYFLNFSNLFKNNKIILNYTKKLFINKVKNVIWFKKIFFFKKFLKISFFKKKSFLRDLSRYFWKIKLKYFFEFFIKIKNIYKYFFYFKIFKINLISFFYIFSSIVNSKYFFLIDYISLRLSSFEHIFNKFLFYLYYFNFLLNFFFLFLFRWLIYISNTQIALYKYLFSIYGVFQHMERIDIYFFNLVNDTTILDNWLISKNICGIKLSLVFTKILLILDRNFNLKRRPWSSFYYRFFDILKYLKKIKNKNLYIKNKLNSFYRIFLKLLLFIKYNKNNFRKKSFKSKPVRRGLRLYM